MNVLIKGLQMPKEGIVQIFINADGMASIYRGLGKADYYEAIPVPDHGRLVDADDVIAESRSGDYWWETEEEVPQILNEIPTIIPAERGEDE